MSKFTEKQLIAINGDGGNFVVSASAGSGKTSVMIERLIRLIVENKADVKEILAVTFTKLSAQEMKERLSNALIEKIKKREDVDRIKRQIKDLPSASISTIDSFLNSLVKKYFYLAGVDASYSIVADAEVTALRNSAVTEVLEKLYETEDEDVNLLLNAFLRKRKDDLLRKTVLELYTFLESEADGYAFLENALSCYSEEGLKRVDNRLIDRFVGKITAYKDDILDLLARANSLNLAPFIKFFESYYVYVKEVEDKKDVEALLLFADFNLRRPGVIKGKDSLKDELSDDAKELCDELNVIKKEIKDYFYADFSERLKDLESPKRILKSLIKVVKLFEEEYSRQKAEENVLDYTDVARTAYKLLQTKEVIDDLKSTYKYVFVDEYQDTNGLQESIFKLLENDNLFLVGDVKQSIYGFRGCNSDNFSSRISQAQKAGGFVELDSNFRSSRAVINTVNKVFSSVMTEKTMGDDYRNHPMIYGNVYDIYEGDTELFYFSDKVEKETLDLGVYSVEKHLAQTKNDTVSYEKLVVHAVRKALKQQICYVDKEDGYKVKIRKAKYSDIAVLNRTVKSGVDRVVKELESAGIPTMSENKRTIATYPEIQQLVNLLNTIITPEEDIYLASALKSPAGGFTDSDLKTIRDSAPTVSFYEATVHYAGLDCELSDRLKEFFSYLQRLRTLSSFEGVPTLIRRILRERNFEEKLLKTPGGEFKLERINLFLTQGYSGERELFLQEFLEYLPEKLPSMTMSSSGGGNAVQVVSMHGSKGLEYPIVIVAGVDRTWNAMDAKAEIVTSRKGGVGLKSYDFESKVYKTNNVRQYVDLVKKEENLQDELRLLYVALTRAKCILYIVSKKQPAEKIKKDILDSKKQLDFLCTSHLKCTGVSVFDLLESFEKENRRDLILPSPNQDLIEPIKEFLEYEYPHAKDTLLSLKRTVTEINKTKADKDFEGGEYVRAIFSSSDVETGNAYHKFLELIDFEKIDDNGLIDRLLSEKFTEEEKNIVDVDKIRAILNLNIFKEVKGMRLYKEQPFIVSLPPYMANESGDEDILLQGVIDLLCIKDGRAVIIDYKHSHKNKQLLIDTYKKQLELYSYAVEKSLGVKVVKKVLVNLLSVEEIVLD